MNLYILFLHLLSYRDLGVNYLHSNQLKNLNMRNYLFHYFDDRSSRFDLTIRLRSCKGFLI